MKPFFLRGASETDESLAGRYMTKRRRGGQLLDKIDELDSIFGQAIFTSQYRRSPSLFGPINISEVIGEFQRKTESLLEDIRKAQEVAQSVKKDFRDIQEPLAREYARSRKKEQELDSSLWMIGDRGLHAQSELFSTLFENSAKDVLRTEMIRFLHGFLKTLADFFEISSFHDDQKAPFSIFCESFILDVQADLLVDHIIQRKCEERPASVDVDYLRKMVKISCLTLDFDLPSSIELIECFDDLFFKATSERLFATMTKLTHFNNFLEKRKHILNGELGNHFHKACRWLQGQIDDETGGLVYGIQINIGESPLIVHMEGTCSLNSGEINPKLEEATMDYNDSPFRFALTLHEELLLPLRLVPEILEKSTGLSVTRSGAEGLFYSSKLFPSLFQLIVGLSESESGSFFSYSHGSQLLSFDISFSYGVFCVVTKRIPFSSLSRTVEVISWVKWLKIQNALYKSMLLSQVCDEGEANNSFTHRYNIDIEVLQSGDLKFTTTEEARPLFRVLIRILRTGDVQVSLSRIDEEMVVHDELSSVLAKDYSVIELFKQILDNRREYSIQ